jgi:hypothetical protein
VAPLVALLATGPVFEARSDEKESKSDPKVANKGFQMTLTNHKNDSKMEQD